MELGPDNALLRFAKASKVFLDAKQREFRAVEDLTLTVREGEFVSIIGPSGCGKSTLLRLAAGLALPTAGEVLYRREAIAGPDPERGFVFQSYNAFPWLTVRENVSFGLHGRNNLNTATVSQWLEWMGLNEFSDAFPKALSGGMRQRLALARTMIVKPRLLLMDEPFGALDEHIRESMQQLLMKIVKDSGCTVLFVTHDIREAILLSSRVLLLSPRPGRILKEFACTFEIPRNRDLIKTLEFNALYESIVDSFPSGS